MLLLKVARVEARFAIDGRLFHNLAPLYEKRFCPFKNIFFGNLGSVAVRLRLYENTLLWIPFDWTVRDHLGFIIGATGYKLSFRRARNNRNQSTIK